MMGATHSDVWADRMTPVVAHTRLSSSTAMPYIRFVPPAPPYCFGTGMPIRPILAIFATVSSGKRSSSSTSAAKGFTSFSANSRIICRKSSSCLV